MADRPDEPAYISEEPGRDPLDRPHPKARLVGGLLLALGALMFAVVVSGQLAREGGRVKAGVGALAGGGTWLGLGLMLFPWSRRMVARFHEDNNLMVSVGRLPPLWKGWAAGTVVAIAAAWAWVITAR
jgi:hypothetical protein